MNDFLSHDLAQSIARLALSGITREFPHKLDHVLYGAEDARTPRALHPAFYGCYDWHSAVHSHWVLVTLLESRAAESLREEILHRLDQHFSGPALQAELAYLLQPGRVGFERPYGWAWLWALQSAVAKLARDLPEARAWHARLEPMGTLLMERWLAWLDRQVYPCRQGTHANTAFALSLALDLANQIQDASISALLQGHAVRLYANDRGFSIQGEPSANDFLSPVLVEAALMTRCLSPAHWQDWWKGFMGSPADVLGLQPANVNDRADAQGVHLDGLNLSRAWHAAEVAQFLPQKEAGVWRELAERHWHAGIRHVCTGDFLGEHWLGTFALAAAVKLEVCSRD